MMELQYRSDFQKYVKSFWKKVGTLMHTLPDLLEKTLIVFLLAIEEICVDLRDI